MKHERPTKAQIRAVYKEMMADPERKAGYGKTDKKVPYHDYVKQQIADVACVSVNTVKCWLSGHRDCPAPCWQLIKEKILKESP